MLGRRTSAAATAAVGLLVPVPSALALPEERIFRAVADAHVTAAMPARSFGSARALRVGGNPVRRAYVRFRITGVSGPVISATLRLHATRGPGRRVVVRRSSTRWSERRLTYRNAPRPGGNVRSHVLRPGWNAIDVRTLVKGNGSVSVAVTGGRVGAASFSSRETPRDPALVVTFGEARPPPPPIPPPSPPTPPPPPPTPPPGSATLIAAGDIATCESDDDEATARILDANPRGTIAALGDTAYASPTATDEYRQCYEPTWGRHKARTRPAAGNHEYHDDLGSPPPSAYFGYFGPAAGDPAKGYYSYDLGAWHIVVLNTNLECMQPACSAGSPQEQWLRADLAANQRACTLAYWHHPLFSSTDRAGTEAVRPFWDALYQYNADVVLAGHAHNYQRYAPQSPAGTHDPLRGIRQFVVGTGGRSLHPVGVFANQEVADGSTFGVLKITLHATTYDWQFLPAAGATFTDSGSGSCH